MQLSLENGIGGDHVNYLVQYYRSGYDHLLSTIKWFLLLNLGLGWILFWGNLVRLHLSMGDAVSAAFTAALFIGPLVVGILWWSLRWRWGVRILTSLVPSDGD